MPARKLTRQDKRQANRARILHAARAVFAQRGYQGATIGEIAGEAGLSNGAVYYNFASKEDLFFALLEEWRTELVHDLASALPRPGSAEPGPSFQDELSHVIGLLKRRREWRLLLFEFATYAARNPRFRARFAAGRQKFKHALASVLAERITAHHLHPVAPPEPLAVLVTALVNGLAFDELTEPDGASSHLLATGLTALIDRRPPPGKSAET
jgi:AcrR family transcriptional regulator